MLIHITYYNKLSFKSLFNPNHLIILIILYHRDQDIYKIKNFVSKRKKTEIFSFSYIVFIISVLLVITYSVKTKRIFKLFNTTIYYRYGFCTKCICYIILTYIPTFHFYYCCNVF